MHGRDLGPQPPQPGLAQAQPPFSSAQDVCHGGGSISPGVSSRSGPPRRAKRPRGSVRPPQGSAGGRPAEQGRPVCQQGEGEGSSRDRTRRRREPDSVGAFYFRAAGCWVVGFSFPLPTQLMESLQPRAQPFSVGQQGSAAGPGCAGLPAAGSRGSGLLRALRPGSHAGRPASCLRGGADSTPERQREGATVRLLAGRNRAQKELGKEGEAFL